MKMYLISLGVGILSGAVYSLLSVQAPAPPMVALVGLAGILVGEQVVPVGRQVLAGKRLISACMQRSVLNHLFGQLPGRQAAASAAAEKIEENHS